MPRGIPNRKPPIKQTKKRLAGKGREEVDTQVEAAGMPVNGDKLATRTPSKNYLVQIYSGSEFLDDPTKIFTSYSPNPEQLMLDVRLNHKEARSISIIEVTFGQRFTFNSGAKV